MSELNKNEEMTAAHERAADCSAPTTQVFSLILIFVHGLQNLFLHRRAAKLSLAIFIGLSGTLVAAASQEKSASTLKWKSGVVKLELSSSLFKANPNIRPDSDVQGAVGRSLKAWENAADVKFETEVTEKQSVSPTGNFGDGASLITIAQTPENLLLFGKDADEVSARTRVFYDKKGTITEADIVLNPYQQFSTDGSVGTFDLESILTHEIGHLLGLEHTSVFGATMHENNGKNGIFNLPSLFSRTLSDSDVSAIRSVYGVFNQPECCGKISGKITFTSRFTKDYVVWAEDSESGKVAAQSNVAGDGSYLLGGLNNGKYRIYLQNFGRQKTILAAEDFGEVEITERRAILLNKKSTAAAMNFDARYLGLNGQLSELSVPLNADKSFTVYIGGKNLTTGDYKIASTASSIAVVPNSVNAPDYGENVSVLSFELKISPNTSVGEYSLYVENRNGQKRFMIGGLSVEEFLNPWNSNPLSNN